MKNTTPTVKHTQNTSGALCRRFLRDRSVVPAAIAALSADQVPHMSFAREGSTCIPQPRSAKIVAGKPTLPRQSFQWAAMIQNVRCFLITLALVVIFCGQAHPLSAEEGQPCSTGLRAALAATDAQDQGAEFFAWGINQARIVQARFALKRY